MPKPPSKARPRREEPDALEGNHLRKSEADPTSISLPGETRTPGPTPSEQMMTNIALPEFKIVQCPWLASLGDDPETFARLLDGRWFCNACGADHTEGDS